MLGQNKLFYKNMKGWRSNIILMIFILIGAAITSRLFFLQIIQGKFYQSQALGQQAGFSEIKGQRGEIFLTNNILDSNKLETAETKSIAINKKRRILSAFVKEIENKNVFAKEISKAIGQTEDFVAEKINNENISYVVIKKDLSEDEILKLKNLKLKGQSIEDIDARYYPQESFAANVIGFLGGDNAGQYGLEGFYEDILRGKSGIKEQKRGLDLLNFQKEDTLIDGSDIYLTIDYNIQFQAESLLKEAKKNLDIDSGQIIVLDPFSGKVLAMASFPSFNLNQYSKEKLMDVFQNASVQKIFEPGSVLKPFTMAIALNEGKITPETKFFDSGSVKVGKEVIHNFDRKKYGEQTMTGVLEKSINTGAVFASKTVDPGVYLEYLEKFGFNKKTGIDLQGETSSVNSILREGREVNLATSSFGQGIEMTPLRLATSFCSIANGGKLVKPFVVEKIVSKTNEKITNNNSLDQVISQHTASQVTTMLINVVENGFGKSAKVPGYYLAGKTGTAEVPIENGSGYYSDRTIQSFIGFGPALDPKFLILVKLDNPKVSASSISAAPIFHKLAKFILNYWQIPPDYENK